MGTLGCDMELLSSLPKGKWWGDDFVYQLEGFWLLPQYLPSTISTIENFKPLPTDVILASFPKTGTTWLKSLVYSIMKRSFKHDLAAKNPHELVPFLEIQVYNEAIKFPTPPTSETDQPRIFSTHIPYQLLAEKLDSSECRVIYVTRNPKDTLISHWHFMNKWKKAESEPWTLEEATEKFCTGIFPYGPYYDHVIGYKSESSKKPDKVFFTTYEELLNDPKSNVLKMVEFLGCHFEGEDEEVDQIVRSCSFKVLSNHEANKSNSCPEWLESPYHSFFRRGGVGDYKNYLSNEDIERIDVLTREKFHSLGFMYGI